MEPLALLPRPWGHLPLSSALTDPAVHGRGFT